jgi:hypothetical protein
LISAPAKSRSWCKDCETWHPRDEHVVSTGLERPSELRAEPRPTQFTPPASSATRRSGWLNFSIFLLVVLPIGVIAWSAAVYVVLRLLPYIKTALQ